MRDTEGYGESQRVRQGPSRVGEGREDLSGSGYSSPGLAKGQAIGRLDSEGILLGEEAEVSSLRIGLGQRWGRQCGFGSYPNNKENPARGLQNGSSRSDLH